MENNLIITCPACGFSFKSEISWFKTKIKKCPMCGYIFTEPDVFHQKPREFDKEFI